MKKQEPHEEETIATTIDLLRRIEQTLDSWQESMLYIYHNIKKNQWLYAHYPDEWVKEYQDIKDSLKAENEYMDGQPIKLTDREKYVFRVGYATAIAGIDEMIEALPKRKQREFITEWVEVLKTTYKGSSLWDNVTVNQTKLGEEE